MWRCRSGHAGLRSRRNLKEDERGRAGEATAPRATACAFRPLSIHASLLFSSGATHAATQWLCEDMGGA